MTNLDSVLKSRDITLLTKFHLVKSMVFPRVVYGCESWTMKNADRQRNDASKLWWWRRLLRVPWPARISNQSILKEISPEYSLEGLMLKLKLQYFGHLMGRADTVEKTLMLGKIEGGREGDDPQDSQESSPTPHSKASILRHSAFFIVQLSHPHVTARKTIALTRQTIGKVMSLLFPRQTIHYHSNPSLCPNQ